VKGAPFDAITIRDIRAFGRHGANAGEQDVPQPIDVTVHLLADIGQARTSDDLRQTIDYAAVHARVVRIVEAKPHRLLEALGESIAVALMDDRRIAMVTVTVAKPQLLDGATPSVTISKMRTRMLGGRPKKKKRTKHASS